ncbi:MAG: inverse autotransporter beta domain-containing protein [Ferrovibrio sp.]|uniref:inverse autotransporter beta domain-containing protein n=1 Tax=Ferrovibrio sp. TaxID=1917215 RepID=UPI002619063D|nr:inverse autotransporter beta domain-containing protein [Ferrovibrio sp.]MCW0234876.1 inverse autotransporter beta domain-containing protein [Ferrovibrio sp.]
MLVSFAVAAQSALDPKWSPHIDVEGKLGTKRNLGEVDAFLPLAQDGATLLFASIRTRMDDNDSAEGNFGLGVRHMLESGWNLGAYGYFDRRRTEYDNHFTQATFGIEALSIDWDARANYYAPVGRRSHQVDPLNTAEVSGTSVVFRGGEERSQGGFDAELGWRVPVFDADAGKALRVYGGGYRFSGNGIEDISGPRLRAELTFDSLPNSWEGSRFSVGAEWQHDDPRGGQGFLSVRLRIPLQIYGRAASKLTPMERRMADPVVRDIDVVAQAGAFGATEIATTTANGQAITVLSSASTSGANLPTAVTNAGANSTVILSGSFTANSNASGITTLQSGQTLMGGGSVAVRAPSGRVATLTSPTATLTGDVGGANATIVMGNNSTLMGLTINNTDATGNNAIAVSANGVSGARIVNNTINARSTAGGTTHGVDVLSSSSNVTVSGNTITVNNVTAGTALGIQVNGSSATVADNTFSVARSGAGTFGAVVFNNGTALAGSTGNTVTAGTACSIVAGPNTGTVSFTSGATCP